MQWIANFYIWVSSLSVSLKGKHFVEALKWICHYPDRAAWKFILVVECEGEAEAAASILASLEMNSVIARPPTLSENISSFEREGIQVLIVNRRLCSGWGFRSRGDAAIACTCELDDASALQVYARVSPVAPRFLAPLQINMGADSAESLMVASYLRDTCREKERLISQLNQELGNARRIVRGLNGPKADKTLSEFLERTTLLMNATKSTPEVPKPPDIKSVKQLLLTTVSVTDASVTFDNGVSWRRDFFEDVKLNEQWVLTIDTTHGWGDLIHCMKYSDFKANLDAAHS